MAWAGREKTTQRTYFLPSIATNSHKPLPICANDLLNLGCSKTTPPTTHHKPQLVLPGLSTKELRSYAEAMVKQQHMICTYTSGWLVQYQRNSKLKQSLWPRPKTWTPRSNFVLGRVEGIQKMNVVSQILSVPVAQENTPTLRSQSSSLGLILSPKAWDPMCTFGPQVFWIQTPKY